MKTGRCVALLLLTSAVASALAVAGKGASNSRGVYTVAATAFPRCSARSTFTYAQKHALSKTVASLMPDARRVGFAHRSDHGPQLRRQPFWPGWCGSWWVEYRDPVGGSGYVDVSFTVYRSEAQALASLQEAAYGPRKTLANGAKVRFAPDGGGIVSVVRNVSISTISSYSPSANGVPDHTHPPDIGVSAQMKIHRRILAGVLRLS